MSCPAPASPPTGIAAKIGDHIYLGCDPNGALIGNVLHVDTLLSTLLVAVVLIGLALYIRSKITDGVPGTAQNIAEFVIEFVTNTARDQIGEQRALVIAPLAVTLAFFIFLSNMLGLIPTGGLFKSPTADVNTPVALALTVMIYVEVSSFRVRKPKGFLKHFVTPWPLTLILIVEELSKPVTLSLRLFGNIASGEVLLVLIGSLPLIGLLSAGLVFNVTWVAFSIFVGAVQTFVFVMLTIAYYGIGTDTEGH